MIWNRLRDNVSLQTVLVVFLLTVEVFNLININNKVDLLWRDVDALKGSQNSKNEIELNLKNQEDCCSKYLIHDRYRRSDSNSRSSKPSKDLIKGEKGDKGDKGMRGPPGLPGMKGETGGCGCFTTAAPETTVLPTIEPRQHDCRVARIGLPLHQAEHDTYWGFWFKDACKDSKHAKHFWMTEHFEGRYLHSFDSVDRTKSNAGRTTHDLYPGHYFGTGHVVCNGSFIYHEAGTNKLSKLDLESMEITDSVVIPRASFDGDSYLYSTNYTYFDLAVDENGLWVVYTTTNNNHLTVSNLDPIDLSIRVTWDIPARSKDFGESFIVCGKLYLVRDTTSTSTLLDSIYDLYTGEWLSSELLFKNPYKLNIMISYNPVHKNIFSWDNGHLLIYPLLLE